ncbi:haloacid dehalogenase [Tritrichomonas foetus]|uniref:Haloacid dehalogenase n=1 Tax=Tritrichomonas foetus TaxID=1144522 RepID=A0A1J4JVJ9_9EUKA|nr:haloacid dehalogenase [Tritrichomonas foetus]|eukprot:OHT03035.1 haloacid dehalogenase [Tritrichomonas foetus]
MMNTNNSCFLNGFDRLIEVYKNFKPFPEVLSTLQEMKNRGYEIVIMSNSENAVMDYNRKALGDLFGDNVLLAQQSKAYKPQLKFFRYVHEKLNFDKNNHTHIAQGYWSDIMPAKLMNWETKIWVNREGTLSSPKFEPCVVVSTLDQALEYLPPVENTDDDEKDFFKSWQFYAICGGAGLVIVVAVVAVVCIKRRKRTHSEYISMDSKLV